MTAAALLAAGLLGWWLVRVGLRPLRAMERSADAIAAGELDQRVAGENERTEVGRLARALNVMLARIQSAFAERDATERDLRASEERMRHFVADASHELRTPLAAVSAYAELFERGADHNEADLGRVMSGIRAESGRMKALVEDLLLLARLDEGRPIEREPVELVGLAAEAAQTAQTIGCGLAGPPRCRAARRDRGRPRSPASGARQPARQRAHAYARGNFDDHQTFATRRGRRGGGRRRRPRARLRAGRPGLRTILPGRPVALPRPRGRRPGPCHRRGHRHRARRPGRRRPPRRAAAPSSRSACRPPESAFPRPTHPLTKRTPGRRRRRGCPDGCDRWCR